MFFVFWLMFVSFVPFSYLRLLMTFDPHLELSILNLQITRGGDIRFNPFVILHVNGIITRTVFRKPLQFRNKWNVRT